VRIVSWFPCLVSALALGGTIAAPRAARAEEPRCQKWTLDVECATSTPRIIVGEEFTATVTAKNLGSTALTNVTLRLRGDQGAPCVSGPTAGVTVLVDKLEPGESKELSARFRAETIGLARVLGSARDSLGWASGSCACSVEVIGLMAIQTGMTDKALDGTERGVFRIGEEFLYMLSVENDAGTSATPDLEVIFALPKELEFVSGSGDGTIKVTGSGQAAKSTTFVLGSPDQKVRMQIRVRAVAAPPSQFLKVRATIQTTGGVILATDTESTTVQ